MAEFASGQGQELKSHMRSLRSSSALLVNVFDYWRGRGMAPLLEALGMETPAAGGASLSFEMKCRIMPNSNPHLDVMIRPKGGRALAIEGKFTEASIETLAESYLKAENVSIWAGLDALHGLARGLAGGVGKPRRLNSTQLVRHVLGLMQAFGGRKEDFELLYLWYDLGCPEDDELRGEIEGFGRICLADGVRFRSLTYQELFAGLRVRCGAEDREYIAYLADRYFC